MASFTSGYRPFAAPSPSPAPTHERPVAEAVSPRSFRVLPGLSDAQVMHRFVVTVETGDNKWAGTDEKVHIQLFGDRGVTPDILLDRGEDMKSSLRYEAPRAPDEGKNRAVFAPGSVREFSFMAAFVGNLVKIRVLHDGGNDYGRAWRLERIVVRDEQLQRSWSFACQIWLNRDNGNEVELVPTGDVAAGRRASIRLSRKRSGQIHRALANEPEPLPDVAAMRSKFSNEAVSVPSASSNSSEGGVRRVCFQLRQYNDLQGHMYLFGAIPALGQWDTTKAHRMAMQLGADGTWRGDWRLELEIDDDFDVIEYKYIQVDEMNDKVHFSDKERVLKLSDGTDSTNRKVEGGVIYVRDSFGGESSKTPFCSMVPGSSVCPTLEKPASTPTPIARELEHTRASLQRPPPSPSPSHKRNSLGFLSRGGSAFLVSEADSAFLTAEATGTGDRRTATETTPNVRRTLDSEDIGVSTSDLRGSYRRDSSVNSDGTAKLRNELEVTRTLLSESKMEMMQKDAELHILQEKLHSATISATMSSSLLNAAQRNAGRGSPVSSECVGEDATSEGAAQNVHNDSSVVEEDAKSETPEGTDSDSTPEARRVPVLNAIPILPTRRSVESQLSTPRSHSRSFLSSPTPSRTGQSPALCTPPVSAQRRYAQRVASAQKVRKAAADVQREVDDLRQDLKDLRDVMAGQCEKYEARQAELVRLVMDASEVRIAEKNAMAKETEILYANWTREFKERRKLFNNIQELRGNIRVFCRVRPLKDALRSDRSQAQMAVSFPNRNIGDAHCIQASSKSFEFSHVFGPEASQQRVYEETSGVIGSVLDGYNVCVFAYGQTGSGKTHTMNGPANDRGVNFRALTDLFKMAGERSELRSVRVVVSMIEIYNDALKDLIFEPKEGSEVAPKLDIRKDGNSASKTAVYIPNLTEVEVASVDEVWQLMEKGAHNRAMEATSMNEHSSRSHLILRVRVDIDNERSGAKTTGLLSLVDLAGSERVSRSNASGERLREAQHINKSLATLGDVFTALLTKSPHVPYRNSKLTYMLQDSLGGDSKTLMFVNVSCDEADASETVSSLQFAQRVAKVELGSAKRHTESLAASKAIASLNEKQTENLTLKSQVAALQREMKKRDNMFEEQKLKLRSVEIDLKAANKALEEKKKRDASDRGGAMRELRELKAVDEKRQTEMRNTKLKAREVTKTKDDEIRRLRHQIEERDKKIAALEQMELRSRSAAKSGASSSHGVSETPGGAVPRVGAGRTRLPRGATMSGSLSSRPRSVRFETPNAPSETTSDGTPAHPKPNGRLASDATPELGLAHRRASSRMTGAALEIGPAHRRANIPSDAASEDGSTHRRATVGSPNDATSESGVSHRRASSRLGEARRVSSMSSIPRAATAVGPPSRFGRPASAPTGGKRVTYAFGTRIDSDNSDASSTTTTASGRPTRPPRASTMKKPPLRHVGLAARNVNTGGVRRANTFSAGSGAGRNTAGRAASKAEAKFTSSDT